MNIARILKDVPVGTSLYSPVCGECTLVFVGPSTTGETCIQVETEDETITFNEEGKLSKNGEEMLYPSYESGSSLADWARFLESIRKNNSKLTFDPNSVVGHYYKHLREWTEDKGFSAFYYHIKEYEEKDGESATIYDVLTLNISLDYFLLDCVYQFDNEDDCILEEKYDFIRDFTNTDKFTEISKEEYEAALPKAIVVNNRKVKTI